MVAEVEEGRWLGVMVLRVPRPTLLPMQGVEEDFLEMAAMAGQVASLVAQLKLKRLLEANPF